MPVWKWDDIRAEHAASGIGGGSDAPETARVEIAYFFNATEIVAPSEALPA